MSLFYYIIIMLAAILISNLINRFFPSFSTPIVQIVLGIVIALTPLDFTLQLNPELFFILFIAPILYNDGMLSDKKALWTYRKPIMLIAFGLVFITILGVGYLVNLLIPSIPIAAAFALAAALSPTDAVAVSALANRIRIPHSIMGILEGEALINDASGIVGFQFAVAAMVTGAFSLAHAGMRLAIVAIGGMLLGLVFAFLKYRFVAWIRSLGIENVTLHILVGLLTPFLVYMIAEYIEVSGILAVVACGIAQPNAKKRLNPEMVRLNLASNSIWSVLSFTLNGLVFLILGTQLPSIIQVVWDNPDVDNATIVICILAFTVALLFIRFLWSLVTIRSQYYADEERKLTKVRASAIIALSGVRGTVTLATAMSIPFVLGDHSLFPERDLIVFIASGVILCTLLIANFLLPLLFKNTTTESTFEDEETACAEIYHSVIMELTELVSNENRVAVSQVIREYNSRSATLQQKHLRNGLEKADERSLKLQTLAWERDNTNALLEQGQVDSATAKQYLEILDRIVGINKHRFSFFRMKHYTMRLARFVRFRTTNKHKQTNLEQMGALRSANQAFVLEKLKELKQTKPTPAIHKAISDYELYAVAMKNRLYDPVTDMRADTAVTRIEDIAAIAFQIERDNIQSMYENGRISRETTAHMRKNISLLETQIKMEEI